MKNNIFVALLGSVLFIPFLGNAHLFDWDEINFAESAREMLVTGDLFRVQINYQPFWEKPPLFFWLQALSMSALGVNEFAARLPNAICGVITLLVIFRIGRRYFSERFGWIWVLFVTGSITPHLYFKSGIIDPVFNLFIFLSLYEVLREVQDSGNRPISRHSVLTGLYAGLAVLTKGPVAVLVLGLCSVLFYLLNRPKAVIHIRSILVSVAVATAVSSIWIVSEIMINGPTILAEFVTYQADLFSKDTSAHTQPWFYHIVVLLFGAFPASLFAIHGFTVSRPADEHAKQLRNLMNILFWVVLIIFSISRTKIVHYTSLCYLPLTFSAAYALDYYLQYRKPSTMILAIGGVIAMLLAIALGCVSLVIPLIFDIIPAHNTPFTFRAPEVNVYWTGYEFLIALAFSLIAIIAIVLAWNSRVFSSVITLLGSLTILLWLLVAHLAPRIESYTQGFMVSYYKTLQEEDCYVTTLGFKSYAHYFYARVKPPADPRASTEAWLLEGNINKPAYFMVKAIDLENYDRFGLKPVWEGGGFVMLRREAVAQ